MSEPSSPSTLPAPASTLPRHRFQREDLAFLQTWAETQPEKPTWDQQMRALAKHLGIEREQLPAEPPSRLN